ncbi:MAG: LPS export ABC transporter permease LptG [Proteobacteria bacterium]|nr:LPS export ABC transporter permease LptG [Pseudomonadota bacterium]
MNLSWTLSQYIAKHFLVSIMIALCGLTVVTSMVDVVELLRRATGRNNIPVGIVLELAALRMPFLAEKLMPYAVLIGSMLALTKLTRSHELIVARAAGVSVWQFLAPAMALVLMLGIFVATVFNPFSAALLMRFEQLEGKYFSSSPSLLSISASGLWLRQIEQDENIGEHIIYTMRIAQSTMEFSNVIVFTFDKQQKFTERLDAKQGMLENGILQLHDVTRSVPGQPAERIERVSLPTTLTLSHIQDSFASPESMSFWSLPYFINMLENAGFSALRHRLYWHSLLASPFLMMGTVLVAAVFSLRLPRRGKIGLLVVAGVITGFLLHFLTDVVFAFGSAGTLPVMLSAWAPSGVVIMIGAALLLQLEDG